MKNTMKKLLCMALVIMLLVSAVPAFAMADELADDFSDAGVDTIEAVGAVSDTGDDYVDNQSDSGAVPADQAEIDAKGVKVVAYLYTGEAKTDSEGNTKITRAKKVNEWSAKIDENVTLQTVLYTHLKQGNRDSNGYAEYQKYDYYLATGKNTELTDAGLLEDLSGTVTGGESDEDSSGNDVYYLKFVRIARTATVRLALEGSDYVADPYTVTIYTVLDLPKEFAKKGLKADAGMYIYAYEVNGELVNTSYRVTGDVDIIGKQDLLSNKAENDASGVGQPNGATGGTTGGTTTGGSSGNSSANGSTGSNKFPYPVYLNIYKDTLVGSPDKRVEITKGAALDGTVTLSEVKNVVKNYYTAKDSDGISYDGLYIAEGNWVADYVADTAKYNSIDAGTMRQTGTVYINVMIGNAKAKSSSTADASNPKTGDAIFVPMMVMGLTGTALAAAYVFGKKRIAR